MLAVWQRRVERREDERHEMIRGMTKRTCKRGGARHVTAIGAAGLMLGGCASFSKDGGMTLVADQTGSILGKDAV